MSNWLRKSILMLTLGLCLAALAYEMRNIVVDYVRPIRAGTFGFVADFQFFYDGAQRFLKDPLLLYEDNTHDGFLLIKAGKRIDFGYPPPAVLLFVPFAVLSKPAAYIAFLMFSGMMTVLCLLVFKRLTSCANKPARLSEAEWVCAAFMFASGMTYVTYLFGQVNAVVLLICLLYIASVIKQRFVLAGILLGIGFWLKFYPLFLLALAPFEKRPIRLILASACSIALIPLLLQPLLPLSLYVRYFSDIYPGLAEQTAPHVYNQSFIGWMTRLSGPDTRLFDWGPMMIPHSVRRGNLMVMVFAFGGIFWGYFLDRKRKLEHYVCVLAVTPMVVTYGWGGTYMLALPLILLTYLWLSMRTWQGSLWGAAIVCVYLLPAYRPFMGGKALEGVFENLYYNRYLYTTLVLLIVCLLRLWAGRVINTPAK